MTDEVKKDEFLVKETAEVPKETAVDKSLLLPGLSGNNPPVPVKGSVKDTNLTNQDGQPLENNSLITGEVLSSDVRVIDKSKEVDLTQPVSNADGTELGKTEVDKDHHERLGERDTVVMDRVSGNPVLVQNRFKEGTQEEFQRLLAEADNSLDGAKIGDIGVGHRYFNLMNKARQYGKDHGLI